MHGRDVVPEAVSPDVIGCTRPDMGAGLGLGLGTGAYQIQKKKDGGVVLVCLVSDRGLEPAYCKEKRL